jgi:hypothetical protein
MCQVECLWTVVSSDMIVCQLFPCAEQEGGVEGPEKAIAQQSHGCRRLHHVGMCSSPGQSHRCRGKYQAGLYSSAR